ncbi:MAG: glycosyltransferase [Candidatus Pacebacteria bacterium]|nr:glycosyltransferase [Candidatus Paceibacterota bacterium]
MISVIIATKNGEKYIARAIKNALEQSVALKNLANPSEFAGFEIVVVSDGSTDTTAQIVRELSAIDSRVRLIELKENVGPGLARNLAILGGPIPNSSISPIKNKFVAILDDDDLWQNPKKLENQIKYLEENPDIVLVGSKKTEFTRENGEHLRWIINQSDPNIIRSNMLSYNPVITSSVVFRTNIFTEVEGFKAMYLAEDYDLWLRMGLHGNISNVEETETTYTMRDGGASKSRQIEMAEVVLRLAKEYRHQYPHAWRAILKGYSRIVLTYWKLIKKGKNPFK